MKRAVFFAMLTCTLPTIACHPEEPKQASSLDPVTEESSSTTSSSGGSSTGRDPTTGPLGSPNHTGPLGKAGKGEATTVSSLSAMMDGMRWGTSHAELTKTFTDTAGILAHDYDTKLAKARVGPEMTALEAERESAKQAFSRSFIEFKDTPTGYDATSIRGEYTYKNRESLMWVAREGRAKRYFFFMNDRLWKMYDEVPLKDGGALGTSFVDAVNKVNAQLGAQGRIQAADATKGINATTVDWKDGASHLRLLDRSAEHVVAMVIEDNGTLGNLASLRTNKFEDPTAIDPSIAAVTKGGLSDPNAAKAAPSASAPSGKKAPPAKNPK
jgi:hypothetical protein